MKPSYLIAGLAALVMIGSQSVSSSAAQASEYSRNQGVPTHRHAARNEMRRQHGEDFLATTARPAMPLPSNAGSLGFIGSSEAGN
jgi:hypothetical protein